MLVHPQRAFFLPFACDSTHLLPESHNLEALKVVELLPLDTALAVLCPGAVVPDFLNTSLLPGGANGSVAGTTGKLLDNDGGEGDVCERDGVAGDDSLGLGGGTVNKDLWFFRQCKFPVP